MAPNRPHRMNAQKMKEWMETQYDLNEKGCWVWKGGKWDTGYGRVGWNRRAELVHRLYWTLSGREILEGLEMRHGQGCSRACFNPEHLTPGTHAENIADKIRDGTRQQGENGSTAKLTNKEVLDIRDNLDNKSGIELAKQYGVTPTHISKIRLGKAWTHI